MERYDLIELLEEAREIVGDIKTVQGVERQYYQDVYLRLATASRRLRQELRNYAKTPTALVNPDRSTDNGESTAESR